MTRQPTGDYDSRWPGWTPKGVGGGEGVSQTPPVSWFTPPARVEVRDDPEADRVAWVGDGRDR